MTIYTAFNLTIHSEFELPELPHSTGSADVVVHLDPDCSPPENSDLSQIISFYTPDLVFINQPDVGGFLVKAGRNIIVKPIPEVDQIRLRNFTVTSALNMILLQRGYCLLHASVIAIDETAVAFVGPCGAGKSTLAACMVLRGHRFLADDMLALSKNLDALPAFPRLKLHQTAIHTLSQYGSQVVSVSDIYDKHLCLVNSFEQQARPLRHIYILDPVPAPRVAVQSVKKQEAMQVLLANSYARPRFAPKEIQFLTTPEDTSRHFLQIAELVKLVAVSRLQRGSSLEDMSLIASLVEHDICSE